MATMPIPALAVPTPHTIRDLELRMEDALDRLRLISGDTAPQDAVGLLIELRSLFLPPKFRATVQLEEEGRKKRSTAAASNWNPTIGEIVIYFEPAAGQATPDLKVVPSIAVDSSSVVQQPIDASAAGKTTVSSTVEVQQCCSALAEAERAGKHFIALKWFRDLVLAGLPFEWAKSPEERQRVLTQAIDSGAILAKKIPNPKYPTFPTTTLTLNRTSLDSTQSGSRFNPVPIKGEPGSVTLLRDRGSY